jgi:hypothetical protein
LAEPSSLPIFSDKTAKECAQKNTNQKIDFFTSLPIKAQKFRTRSRLNIGFIMKILTKQNKVQLFVSLPFRHSCLGILTGPAKDIGISNFSIGNLVLSYILLIQIDDPERSGFHLLQYAP